MAKQDWRESSTAPATVQAQKRRRTPNADLRSTENVRLRVVRTDGAVHQLPRTPPRDLPSVLGCVVAWARPSRARDEFVPYGNRQPGQHAPQMALAEHDHVVETFAPEGSDQPLRERILPRAASANGRLS